MIPIAAKIARAEEGSEHLVASVLLVWHHHKVLLENMCLLTSSLRTPEVIVKEFFNGFVTFHDHCSGEYLSVERQSNLYSRHRFSHSQYFVYA